MDRARFVVNASREERRTGRTQPAYMRVTASATSPLAAP